jgi:hypothetical protein
MILLSVNFGFTKIVDGETLVSKVLLPLPLFPLAMLQGESNDHFLVRVELDVENVVGSYGRAEHDALIKAMPNEGRLNRVFKKAGVAYRRSPQPSTEASTEAANKKVDACVWLAGNR